MIRRTAVGVMLLLTVPRQTWAEVVSWCTQNSNIKIGISSLPADELDHALPELTTSGHGLRQIYAGRGLDCASVMGFQIADPQPTYALVRAMIRSSPDFNEVSRVSYLGDSIVLDKLSGGTVEHRVIRGNSDVLELNLQPYDASILYVNLLQGPRIPSDGRSIVFVKTLGPLTRDAGKTIFESVQARLGFEPFAVYIRNDVYFVEPGYPLEYFFADREPPSIEEHKGTITLRCARIKGAIGCATTWE